jgi:hypothetical protein
LKSLAALLRLLVESFESNSKGIGTVLVEILIVAIFYLVDLRNEFINALGQSFGQIQGFPYAFGYSRHLVLDFY